MSHHNPWHFRGHNWLNDFWSFTMHTFMLPKGNLSLFLGWRKFYTLFFWWYCSLVQRESDKSEKDFSNWGRYGYDVIVSQHMRISRASPFQRKRENVSFKAIAMKMYVSHVESIKFMKLMMWTEKFFLFVLAAHFLWIPIVLINAAMLSNLQTFYWPDGKWFMFPAFHFIYSLAL